jgi:hypothetical protein
MSVVSAFFTIYAYDALRPHLDRIEHMDFLFGEPRFIRSLDPDKTEKKRNEPSIRSLPPSGSGSPPAYKAAGASSSPINTSRQARRPTSSW